MNVKDRWGRTPVDDAVMNSRTLVARLLFSAGSRPHPAGMAEKLTGNDAITMASIGWNLTTAGATLASTVKAYQSV